MKKSKLVRMTLLAGCLSACGQAELPAEPGDYAGVEPKDLVEERVEREPAEAPPPLRPMNAWEGVEELEAATGQRYLVMQGPTGLKRVPYVEKDGMAVVGGDVVLGSVEEVRQARERGIGITEVWFPDGRLPWFNDDLNATGLANVRKVAQLLESRTPLDLDEVIEGSERAIRMKRVDLFGSVTNSGGMTQDYWQPGEGTPKIVYSRVDPTQETILHELGHAMGLTHEFQRPDRDTYVDSVNGCGGSYDYARIDSAWWSGTASHNLSPFDFQTIMKHGYETCVVLKPGYNWDTPEFWGSSTPLSRQDINSIYRMYAGKLAQNEANDGFGLAVASADFDADSHDDIAVGFRDYITSGADAGKFGMWVAFFRGVRTDPAEGSVTRRFVPWFMKQVGVTELGNETMALATGDFNDDFIQELAIGMPWYNGGKGLVKVWFLNTGPSDANRLATDGPWAPWGRKGVLYEHTITPSFVGLNSTGAHRFGAALTTGKITTRRNYSGDFDDLIIGAPKATNGMLPPMGKYGGAVAHVRGVVDTTPIDWTPTAVSLTWSPSSVSGAEFGAALTVLPHFCDNSGFSNDWGNSDTFVVGAPGYSNETGAVYVYGCAFSGAGSPYAPALLRTLTGSQAGARFGHAVAGFQVLKSNPTSEYTEHYLVTGAPGYTGSNGLASGIVYLDHLEQDGTRTFIDSYRPGTHFGGDEFGYSLAVQQNNSPHHGLMGGHDVYIGIGMPGTQVDGVAAGKVYIWRPWNADGTSNSTAHVVSAPNPTSATATRFGQTLAAVDWLARGIDDPGFVAGAPLSRELDDSGSNITAGSIEVILNATTSSSGYTWTTSRRHLNEESTGDRLPTNR